MKRLRTKELIFLTYFIATFILRKISGFSLTWYFLVNSFSDLILWFSGALIGAYFIKIDQLIYIYFTQPQASLSLEFKSLKDQKRKKEAWGLLKQRVTEQRLAFRSVLFQAGWIILALFTLTSTAGVFGKTLVMAIGLHLLLDEWQDVLKGRDISWLFWQIKRPIPIKEQKAYLWIMTALFGILSLLLI